MKLPWDKKYICLGITTFVTAAAIIVFYMMFKRWETVRDVLGLIAKSLSPITFGIILAYILNPLLNGIELRIVNPAVNKLFKKTKINKKGLSRAASIVITWAIAIFFVVALFLLVFPEIYESIESLIANLPEYANHAIKIGEGFLEKNPEIIKFLRESVKGFTTNLEDIAKRIEDLIPNINVLIVGLSSSVYGAIKVLINTLVGIIVSVYILKDKEKFIAQGKRLLYSSISIKKANRTVEILKLTHDKFANFITGKIFDSIIIGILCFIILSIFNIPYSVLVSVIVGVTNVIPFFGPFIGAIPSALLILFVAPVKCITFVIIILLLQQFDGNILGPKILGSSTGVSSFWVIFSILVGSGLFGVWGMVCAVPVFAVVYSLVREFCKNSLTKKGINYPSEVYRKLKGIDEVTKNPDC